MGAIVIPVRSPRRQKGQRVETRTTFFLRYYVTTQDETGAPIREQKLEKLADKNDVYRTWDDVEPLIDNVLRRINEQADVPTGQVTFTEFVEEKYLPYADANRSAATANGYRRVWDCYWKPKIGKLALTSITRPRVNQFLTEFQNDGLGSTTTSHIKWFLSGVYVYAINTGVLGTGSNPVHTTKDDTAKPLGKAQRRRKQAVYSLETVLAILKVLEPVDLRAVVAVALSYFAALRPSEVRGLQWQDWRDDELDVRRSVWRNHVGDTKTEDSVGTVPVIEPLKGLLDKLHEKAKTQGQAKGYILQNAKGNALSLDSLNYRVITPALEKAGIDWQGYYACRRGISSKVTDVSKNALNSTGLLRHSTPITALKHYTRAQKDSIAAAMDQVEAEAELLRKKLEGTSTVQ